MRVLVATDGSEDARAAVEWLKVFPLPATADVLVLTVAELPSMPPMPLETRSARELVPLVVGAAHRVAEEACDALALRWPTTTMRMVDGDPRDAIPMIADEWGADLVVVGARGLDAVHRFLLGSVSSAVVRATRCPVLVVKPHAPACANIVIGIDGSADALAAARFVARLPLERRTRIRLVGAIPRPYTPRTAPEAVMPVVRAAIDDIIAVRRGELAGVLANVADTLKPRATTIDLALRVGPPADEILAETDDRATDLVVVGARGLGAVKRLVLGSVSERVLHHATCPVLVVKGV